MEKEPQDSESRHVPKYIIRFSEGLRDAIAEEAKANNRSMNAEINARLEQSLAAPSADSSLRTIARLELMLTSVETAARIKTLTSAVLAETLARALDLLGEEDKKKVGPDLAFIENEIRKAIEERKKVQQQDPKSDDLLRRLAEASKVFQETNLDR